MPWPRIHGRLMPQHAVILHDVVSVLFCVCGMYMYTYVYICKHVCGHQRTISGVAL